MDAYATCYASPSCKSDDDCILAAGFAAGGQASNEYAIACEKKWRACGSDSPGLEYCTPVAYAYAGVGPAATACLAKPCADQRACFAAALKPIADCTGL